MPNRIQLSRARGWRKPADAVVVSRPTKWGNPWLVIPVRDPHFPFSDAADVKHCTQDAIAGRFERYSSGEGIGAPYWAVQHYKLHLAEHPELIEQARAELRGRDLACWCDLAQPCHADVLLEIANKPNLELVR